MFFKKLLPVLLLVSLLAGGIFQPSTANLRTKSLTKDFLQPAATIYVCRDCDFTSIQEAINHPATVNGDRIVLDSETYTETITIDKDLSIFGTGNDADGSIIQATGNVSQVSDSVVTVLDGASVIIDGIILRHGNSGGGGGILNQGTLTIKDVLIEYNQADEGGGILNRGTLTISNSLISGNNASNGGGIANLPLAGQAKVTISNSTFDGNQSGLGAGIYNSAFGTGTIAKVEVFTSTISNNEIDQDSSYGGGAANIAVEGTSALIITNSTISYNIVENGGGGGIYTKQDVNGTAETTIVQSTIALNLASNGSNLYADSGSTSLDHSILAYGQGGLGFDCYKNEDAIISDGGLNLVEDGCYSISASGDPGLNPSLDNTINGGDTKTHAVYSSSPAVDIIPTNQCSTSVDQRGVVRPYGGGCDSGAFELNKTEFEFSQYADITNFPFIKPGELIPFMIIVETIGPGISGGVVSADTPTELTIEGPIVMEPSTSGEIGLPPILAHDIVLPANQMITITVDARVAVGIKAGTPISQTVSITSDQTPNDQEDVINFIIENIPPIAVDDQGDDFKTSPDTEIFNPPNVLDNDIDLNGDILFIIGIVTDTLKGELVGEKDSNGYYTGIFHYDPNGKFDDMIPGSEETDIFSYTITDNQGGIGGEDATAKVTITLRLDAFTLYVPLVNK